MKNINGLLVILLALIAVTWAVTPAVKVHAAEPQAQGSTALERGYRTGYSDGYQSGYKDQSDHSARDFAGKEEYQHADRAYVEAWGPLEDYRDGYQQGYEQGYGAGFERQQFNSALPTGFKKRGTDAQNDAGSQNNNQNNSQNNNQTGAAPQDSGRNNPNPNPPDNAPPNMSGNIAIPHDTVLLIELESSLSTEDSQRGDRFQSRVIEPREYSGAVIEGRVNRAQKGGKVKGDAELQLSFEQIRLPDNRTANLHAEVIEVVASGGSTGVGDVDSEGGVRGKSTTKDDITKVGAATGIGAIIGAIAGGGKGAAIGAAIGGGVGTAGVITTRGKDIRLAKGQQLRIRTSTDTSIQ
jgi:hypothetical protein